MFSILNKLERYTAQLNNTVNTINTNNTENTNGRFFTT